MLQLHLSDRQFYSLLMRALYKRLNGIHYAVHQTKTIHILHDHGTGPLASYLTRFSCSCVSYKLATINHCTRLDIVILFSWVRERFFPFLTLFFDISWKHSSQNMWLLKPHWLVCITISLTQTYSRSLANLLNIFVNQAASSVNHVQCVNHVQAAAIP